MNKLKNTSLFFVIINSIIGGGLFINLTLFSQKTGSFSPFLYLLAYFIVFPIIFCIGFLAQKQTSEGGLFLLTKNELGESLGFISVWCYFLGRIVSVGLLLEALSQGLLINFPQLHPLSGLKLPFILVFAMSIINICGLRNTGSIQKIFTGLKLLPLISLITAGGYYFSTKNFNFHQDYALLKSNFQDLLPSAIYAMQGFTIVIHIGHLIKNPESLLRTLIFGTGAASLICIAFQLAVFSNIGLLTTQNTLATFFANINITHPFLLFLCNNLINCALFSCTFMILTGNAWNLFTLAKNNFIPGKHLMLTTINETPAICVIIHAIASFAFLSICQNLQGLQAASVFAVFITYLLCSASATISFFKSSKKLIPIGFCALLSCLYILHTCFWKIIIVGISYEFAALFFIGSIFWFQKKHLYA